MYPDVFEEVEDVHDDATRTPFATDTCTGPSTPPVTDQTPISSIIAPLIQIASPRRGRYAYQSAEPTVNNCCGVCEKKLDMTCPERVNGHLLQCAQRKRINDGRTHMDRQFASHPVCLWNECHFRFKSRRCTENSLHITDHIMDMRSKQCLWDGCNEVLRSF
jgi:hypothetical protein